MEDNWIAIIKVFENLPRKEENLPRMILLSNENDCTYEVTVTKSADDGKQGKGYRIMRNVKSERFPKIASVLNIQDMYIEDVTLEKILCCYALGRIWSIQIINV